MTPQVTAAAPLEVCGLVVEYARPGAPALRAVDGVSLAVGAGRIVGLVGESGCGKTSVARAVCGLVPAAAGQVLACGRDVTNARGAALRELYRSVQMVFQSPAASFDPRRTLGYSVTEGLRLRGASRARAREAAGALFERCGLPPELMDRYPHEVSGGQCQRAAFVRALAAEPALLVCDEVTSALDATVQAQICDLVRSLRDERRMGVLFICHDLALTARLCDDVVVMRGGRVVESGLTAEVLASPREAYTRDLLAAARAVSL